MRPALAVFRHGIHTCILIFILSHTVINGDMDEVTRGSRVNETQIGDIVNIYIITAVIKVKFSVLPKLQILTTFIVMSFSTIWCFPNSTPTKCHSSQFCSSVLLKKGQAHLLLILLDCLFLLWKCINCCPTILYWVNKSWRSIV